MRLTLLSIFLCAVSAPVFAASVTYSFVDIDRINSTRVLAQFTAPDFLTTIAGFPRPRTANDPPVTTSYLVTSESISFSAQPNAQIYFDNSPGGNLIFVRGRYFDTAAQALRPLFVTYFRYSEFSQTGFFLYGDPSSDANMSVAQRGDAVTLTPEPSTAALLIPALGIAMAGGLFKIRRHETSGVKTS